MTTTYEAPLHLMRLALHQAADATGLSTLDGMADVFGELADTVLESAARFAGEVLSPLNPAGDRSPARCTAEGVVTTPGFADAYRRFREDGWTSLGAPEEFGGQGLPLLLSAAVTEMWGGANLAFAMCPEVAVGAIEALRAHAPQELRETYLPRLVSGEWTASMALTEPQAGSDLSTLRTRAEPDGTAWRLFGRKIYISWGDHDMAENIVHLVLARAPDAPAGTKGLSLFLVPKFVPAADGTLVRNDVHAVSLEHKMGIRASPTCVLALGDAEGARGWLVGRLHEGLACMFTMMNHMRLGVGLHSTGLAERACQLALSHARERLQGRDARGEQRPIIEHADVRRMLLTMRALTHAARCLAYTAAAAIDVAHGAPDEAVRAAAERRASLLTPVVKAWCSETAVEVASLGVQVHGGAGFIDDAEISQVYRDARIGPIFEGTNYIQAQDLLGRKIVRDGGRELEALITEMEAAAQALSAEEHALARLRDGLLDGCARLRAAATELVSRAAKDTELVGATAYHFLHWLGVLAGGWQWALAARRAVEDAGTHSRSVVQLAAFYAAHVLPRAAVHEAIVLGGAEAIAQAELA